MSKPESIERDHRMALHVAGFILTIGAAVVRAKTIFWAWPLVVAPLGVPPLSSAWHAYALMALFGLFHSPEYVHHHHDERSASDKAASAFVAPLVSMFGSALSYGLISLAVSP